MLVLPHKDGCCSSKGGPEGDGSSQPSIPCRPTPLGCSSVLCGSDSIPTASLAADEDLEQGAGAGGAVQGLAAEGDPGLLCAHLRLPHQHVALDEEMIPCALTSPAWCWQGGEGRVRIPARVLAASKPVKPCVSSDLALLFSL